MCGISEATVGDTNVAVRLGYVRYITYGDHTTGGAFPGDKVDCGRFLQANISVAEMKNLLCRHTQEELAQLIVDLVANSEEV
jgi:hypothetical protein